MIGPKNGDKTDIRLENLKVLTRSEIRLTSNVKNKLGVKGVSQIGKDRFEARICLHGNTIRLGDFPTAELAGQAYKQKSFEVLKRIEANG